MPKFLVGATAGNLNSMLSSDTAARHKRKEDVYSEGGIPGKRPNHAVADVFVLALGTSFRSSTISQ